MRIFLLGLLLLNCTLLSAQSSAADVSNDSDSVFYIFVESWPAYDNKKKIKTDNSPNYLQIANNTAIVSGRYGFESVFITGNIEEYSDSKNDKGKMTKFLLRGTGESKGKKIKIEIITDLQGTLTVHVFETLGTFNRYFSARPSSKEEEIEIAEFWDNY